MILGALKKFFQKKPAHLTVIPLKSVREPDALEPTNNDFSQVSSVFGMRNLP